MENKSELFVLFLLLIGVVCNCIRVGNTDEAKARRHIRTTNVTLEVKSLNITTNTTILRCGSGKFLDVKNTNTPLGSCNGYSTCVLTKGHAEYQNVLYSCRDHTYARWNNTCLTVKANTTGTLGCELNDIVMVDRAWIDKFECPNIIAPNVQDMTENVSTLCNDKSSCSIHWIGNIQGVSNLINIQYRCLAHNQTSVTTSAYMSTEVGAIVGGVLGTIVIIILLLAIIMIRQRKRIEGRTANKNKRIIAITNQVFECSPRILNSTSASSSSHDKPMSQMISMNSMQTRIEENSQNKHNNVDGVENYDHLKPDLAISSINVESDIETLTNNYGQFTNNFEVDDTYDHTSTNRTDNNDSVGNYNLAYLQNTTEDEYNTTSSVNASVRDNSANYTNFEI